MEIFGKAATVRLRSRHGKYLYADDDGIAVTQSHDGVKENAKWSVEIVDDARGRDRRSLRLRSCHGMYLTASPKPFLLGMTGHRVLQKDPATAIDSSVSASACEWEPIKDGYRVMLRSKDSATYLRGNFSLPPWRNSVTHDIPERTATQDWILWEVEITEVMVRPDSP